MESTREWFTNNNIQSEHLDLPIRQIYLWFITNDNKMPIVAGTSGNFQLPGGKPEPGETKMQTIKREMFEETGIEINFDIHTPVLFGYYLIENDESWNSQPYLQIRYILKVEEDSKSYNLSTNERSEDKDQMAQVRFINLSEIPAYISYLMDMEEYKLAMAYSKN